MTVLNVDEVEPEFPHKPRSAMKLFDDGANFRVSEYRKVSRQTQAAIKYRVVIKDSRLRLIMHVRTAITARMRELQADQQSVIRTRDLTMRFDEREAQSRYSSARVRRDQELIRIGAAAMRHSDCFPAPN